MADIKDQLIKDSYNYVLQSDLSTGVVYRIGGAIPVNPIFSSGLTINDSFVYSGAGEQNGYALLTDGTGYAYWGPVSAATPSGIITGATSTGTGVTVFNSIQNNSILINSITGDSENKITTSINSNTIELGINEQNLTLWDLVVQGNKLLSGNVSYVSGLTFSVSPLEYLINGEIYNISSPTNVTLQSGDSTYDRIDVIYADINGLTGVLEGTPSANPEKALVDGDTQVEVTFVLVKANSTSADITSLIIYNEDSGPPSEWEFTSYGPQSTRIIGNSTGDAYSGTTSIQVSGVTGAYSTYFRLSGLTEVNTNDYATIQFALKNLSANTTTSRIRLRFLSSTGVQNGSQVFMNSAGSTGYIQYSSSNVSSWQLISIPLWRFYLSNTNVSQLEVAFYPLGSGSQARYYFDLFEFIEGASSSPPSNSWTTIQADGTTTITAPNPNATLSLIGGVNINTTISGTSSVVFDLDNNISLNSISATTYYNLPYSGTVNGNGTTNYLPKWTGSTGLGNSLIYDNGTNVGIGTSSPTTELEVSGTVLSTDFIATNSGQANNIFPKDDVDLNLSTRTNTGTKSINLRTGTGSGGFGDIQLSVTSLGYVGIGTSSPSAKLDINASTGGTIGVRISGDSSSDMLRITQTGSGNALIIEDEGNPDSTPFTVTSDGKVYIGTTDPTTSILNVGGNSHFYGNIFLNGTTNRTIQNSTPGRALINFATAGDSYFNNGSLGIGTISPGSKLDINASTGSTIGLRVSGGSSVDMVRITQTGSGNAIVVEDDSNPDSTPFVVTSGGTVGIGINSPLHGYKLHVRNGAATNSVGISGTMSVFESSGDTYVSILSPDANTSGIAFGTDDVRSASYLRWSYTNNQMSLSTNRVGASLSFSTDDEQERMLITSGGSVGIGTSSPSANLHVTGDTLIQGSLTATTKTTIGSESNISSALLQMASTTQGVLFPRMTNTQRESIVSPVPGLFVYCTDSPEGLFMYKSTGWVQIM